ncbi:hypothetical protein F01_230011 [Burkholderia cenocepacia]|nr:hypothetical protein F01_230011 [Burkholderia cenocepacia]
MVRPLDAYHAFQTAFNSFCV